VTLSRRFLLGSLALLAMALTAGAGACRDRPVAGNLVELAAAVGSQLPFEVRLSGGFHPPSASMIRRAGAPPAPLPPDARIAIARLEKRAEADDRPQLQAALGVAYLVDGDVDRGVATLENAVSRQPTAPAWSDLSAGYLAKADRLPLRRVEYLARALDAAGRSLRIAATPEARFNRALALEAFAPAVGDGGAWADCVRLEPDRLWRDAAARHAAVPPAAADAGRRWNEQSAVLYERLSQGDRAYIADTAAQFPEALTEWFDQDLAVAWARARLRGDDTTAAARLADMQLVAAAISATTHDGSPIDAVAAARSASASRAVADAHIAYADANARYNVGDYASA
jgi:hypothetical protein